MANYKQNMSLVEKKYITTHTVVNGKRYDDYDEFVRNMEILKSHIDDQLDYKVYPEVPADMLFILTKIFERASKEEKKFIFSYLLSKYEWLLRENKVNLDELWTEKGIERHKKDLEKYAPLLPYLKGGSKAYHQGK